MFTQLLPFRKGPAAPSYRAACGAPGRATSWTVGTTGAAALRCFSWLQTWTGHAVLRGQLCKMRQRPLAGQLLASAPALQPLLAAPLACAP